MKIKTTKKAVKNNYNHIIGIGYCNAQYLLGFAKEFGYSAGSNGWACDYYDVNGVCISTGYSYIHGVKYDYDMLNKYELEAQSIRLDNSLTWEVKEEKINQLLKDFVNECIK